MSFTANVNIKFTGKSKLQWQTYIPKYKEEYIW